MKCCILSCKSYSGKRSNAIEGITFHIFPINEKLKKKWLSKINRENWTPSKHTKICSYHFKKEDFQVTTKGLRRIRKGALPSLNLCLSLNKKLIRPKLPFSQKKKQPQSPTPTPNVLDDFIVFHDTPKEKLLKQELAKLRLKARKDILKIKSLGIKVTRLKNKVLKLTNLVKELENKNIIVFKEEAETLPSIDVKTEILD